ncbi:hypothetical protein B0H17DRAFT_1134123 [Mycena rosella]|uniref:Uncharacterized protein n=1 Tax=Mycena rosella TaxID=1033263 RepID=A0AAD7GE98_MYCRO|nr:hypothetical protein B0H17DRAFT_1134123 [Mycena rosella]
MHHAAHGTRTPSAPRSSRDTGTHQIAPVPPTQGDPGLCRSRPKILIQLDTKWGPGAPAPTPYKRRKKDSRSKQEDIDIQAPKIAFPGSPHWHCVCTGDYLQHVGKKPNYLQRLESTCSLETACQGLQATQPSLGGAHKPLQETGPLLRLSFTGVISRLPRGVELGGASTRWLEQGA